MQERYVGDVGDFGKYGLLRAICRNVPQFRVGVVWYFVDRGENNNDGRHTDYLSGRQPEECRRGCKCFRACDASLFDKLQEIVGQRRRCLSAIHKSGILPHETVFFDEPIRTDSLHPQQRPTWRVGWLERALTATEGCDLVFLDPDNGLQPESVEPTHKKADKHVFPTEITAFLDRGQAVVLYHHLARRKGGHEIEIAETLARFRQELDLDQPVVPLWYRRGTSRLFLVLPATDQQSRLLQETVASLHNTPWYGHSHFCRL